MAQGHWFWLSERQARGRAVLREQDPSQETSVTWMRGCLTEQLTDELGRWRRSCQRGQRRVRLWGVAWMSEIDWVEEGL